jgi:hypothetical protein
MSKPASSLLDRVRRQQPQSAAEFIAGAEEPRTTPSSSVQTRPPEAPLAHALDPWAVPRYTFNLRFNEYQLTLLRRLAAADAHGRSMQEIAKEGLIPILEQRARDLGIDLIG